MNENNEPSELISNYLTATYTPQVVQYMSVFIDTLILADMYEELEQRLIDIIITDEDDTDSVRNTISDTLTKAIIEYINTKGIYFNTVSVSYSNIVAVLLTIDSIEDYSEINTPIVVSLLSDDSIDNVEKFSKVVELYNDISWIELFEVLKTVTDSYISTVVRRLDNLTIVAEINDTLINKYPELSNTNIGRLIIADADNEPTTEEYLSSLYDTLEILGYGNDKAVDELVTFILMCADVDDKFIYIDTVIKHDIELLSGDDVITKALLTKVKYKINNILSGV